jgi:hypothetical protein
MTDRDPDPREEREPGGRGGGGREGADGGAGTGSASGAGSRSGGKGPSGDDCDLPALPEGIDIPDSPGQLSDEETLRRLLHDAVGVIPVPDVSLEALREGIATRRRRRRQLLLSTVAAVGVLAIGAPAVLEATGNGGRRGNDQATGLAGESTAEGEPVPSGGADGGAEAYDGIGEPPLGGEYHGSDDGQAHQPDGTSGAVAETGAPYEGEITGIDSPRCSAGQLGAASAVTEQPDAQGKVYGTIRVANVSAEPCRVSGSADDLAVLPALGGTAGDVQIADRAEGDRATGLPTPDQAVAELVLPPGEAYEVRFAWVPSGGSALSTVCAVQADPGGLSTNAGAAPDPVSELEGGAAGAGGSDGSGSGGADGGPGGESPGVDQPSAGNGNGGGGDGGDDGSPGGGGNNGNGNGTPGNGGSDPSGGTSDPDPDPSDSTVVLRYTPPAGGPAVDIHLEGTCNGTVYRTGVLESPSTPAG